MNSKNEYLCFWLDRKAFMQNVFNAFDCMNLNEKNEVKVNDRITIQNTDKYQLTYLRCDQVAQFTERLMKCDSLMKQNAVCNQFLFKVVFFFENWEYHNPQRFILIFSDNTMRMGCSQIICNIRHTCTCRIFTYIKMLYLYEQSLCACPALHA